MASNQKMSRRPEVATHTWEQAIATLRRDPAYTEFISQAYLTEDLAGNCVRFASGAEYAETLSVLRRYAPNFKTVLDMPGGNGIATVAFAKDGFTVTTVEPDPSDTVGRGAIETVLRKLALHANVVDAYGEELPFVDNSFDVVYVRQGLHHARNLKAMVAELSRVLKVGGLLLAVREHVVDNYGTSLRAFLDSQVDHQLYGGENAFTLSDYRHALNSQELERVAEWGPYDSPINLYPNDSITIRQKILSSTFGRLLGTCMPHEQVCKVAFWWLKVRPRPGRLHTFLYRKLA